MVETQKIHEKFKLSCMGMTYPRAFWRFMEIFLSGYGVCAAPYIPIVCICDKIDLLFTKKRPRSLRSYSERGRFAFQGTQSLISGKPSSFEVHWGQRTALMEISLWQ